MAPKNMKVYLDHHIKRDSLLYDRQVGPVEDPPKRNDFLTIQQLHSNDPAIGKHHLLRKPDFQRATWAWTPEDCVELLDTILQEQVVPSVVMWLSPDQYQYVLDGGHRISVLLAWIRNNWGDSIPNDEFKDDALARDSRLAAKRVRELLRSRSIGSFEDYISANARYTQIKDSNGVPDLELDSTSLEYARLVRRWSAVEFGFPILWVKGDRQKAEESFIKINKSGRRLSDWETKLVENRSSSFARVVMSTAHVYDADHCWPINPQDISSDKPSRDKVKDILLKVQQLHDLLFTPVFESPVRDPRQPLVATPYAKPEMKPAYMAEILTITEGKRGQKPETEKLIAKDRVAPVPQIISNGQKLVTNAIDVIGNIYGNSPRSLGLMPLVYFYSRQGVYVRSLLYGMIYWLNHGSENKEVLERKRLFCVHRRAFEEIIIRDKDIIISRIARRIGSGPEVTYPTARYYDGLLRLLITHSDNIASIEFQEEHSLLIETLDKKQEGGAEIEVESKDRIYRGQNRTAVHVKEFMDTFVICEICGGRYFPGLFTQVDHVQMHSQQGKTVLSNARNTHPFCNNNRPYIEAIRLGENDVKLPTFENPESLPIYEQMNFLASFSAEGEESDEAEEADEAYESEDGIVSEEENNEG